MLDTVALWCAHRNRRNADKESQLLETTYPRVAKEPETINAAGIFGGPQVLFVHMKPTHEPQNPMVYGVHRRTPFMNNTMSQAFAVPECTATRRGTSGRTSSRCSTESARCVLSQQRMLQAPTHTNRQGCEHADAGREWFLRQAGRGRFVEDNRLTFDQLSSTNSAIQGVVALQGHSQVRNRGH